MLASVAKVLHRDGRMDEERSWQQPAGCKGGQSSHDTWDVSWPRGKWREISAEMDAVGTAVKEESNTWTKAAKQARRQKPNCSKWSKLRSRTKRKRKEKQE